MSEPKYKLVPVEPTDSMCFQGRVLLSAYPEGKGTWTSVGDAKECYRNMVAATPSPSQDPRDEDAQYVKRLKAAWDSAHQQAMENGAKYKQAMEALRVAREALELINKKCCGEALPAWDASLQTTVSRGYVADVCDAAEYKIKEMMGEK